MDEKTAEQIVIDALLKATKEGHLPWLWKPETGLPQASMGRFCFFFEMHDRFEDPDVDPEFDVDTILSVETIDMMSTHEGSVVLPDFRLAGGHHETYLGGNEDIYDLLAAVEERILPSLPPDHDAWDELLVTVRDFREVPVEYVESAVSERSGFEW
jgi:hypothetical protein